MAHLATPRAVESVQNAFCSTSALFGANLGGIEALLKAMKDHPTITEVQQQACAALYNLSGNAENKVKISNLGAEEHVRRAMAAANATEDTKKWGQWLLDRLAQC